MKFTEILKKAPAMWEVIFIICFLLSGTLIVVSFILPPKGVIDNSVLKATGELLAFPTIYAACKCIMMGLGVTVTKGDTTIQVKGKDEKTNA